MDKKVNPSEETLPQASAGHSNNLGPEIITKGPEAKNSAATGVENAPAAGGSSLKLKPLISFLTLFSFLVLAFSGFVLYVRPEGSIARWIGWKLIGLDKSGWETVHIIFCVTFVAAGLVHFILNFKAVVYYLTVGFNNGRRNRAELAIALLLVIALLFSAIWKVPPASWLKNIRDDFKNNPAGLRVPVPFADFEKQSLKKIANFLGMETEALVKKLGDRGIKVADENETLEKLARRYGLSPQSVYQMIVE